MIRAVILDFGGVIAEEGFREGLKAIAQSNGLDPEEFFNIADSLIYETGYVKGLIDEGLFWEKLKKKTGIKGDDKELREEILNRFILRGDVLDLVDHLRRKGIITAILSDQTNWLDEINEKKPFYHHFDYVFNSYKIGKGKREAGTFLYICSLLNIQPEKAIFVDDNPNNIKNAEREGLYSILYRDLYQTKRRIEEILAQATASDQSSKFLR